MNPARRPTVGSTTAAGGTPAEPDAADTTIIQPADIQPADPVEPPRPQDVDDGAIVVDDGDDGSPGTWSGRSSWLRRFR